jgi:hypothetical protein
LAEIFKKLINKMPKNEKFYYGFYPAKYKNNSGVESDFRPNQRAFDSIIMKNNGISNELEIVFFDWTGGKIK